MHRVDGIIESYQTEQPIEGVAISTAGVLDTGKGEILDDLQEVLPGYAGVNWKDHIGRIFQLTCAVENDVKCAALGELWHSAGKGMSSLVCMTIGTSIGGAIIIDKKSCTACHTVQEKLLLWKFMGKSSIKSLRRLGLLQM